MKSPLAAYLVSLIVFPVFALAEGVVNNPAQKISPEAFRKAIYKKSGGYLKVPGAQRGRFVIVNSCGDEEAKILESIAEMFRKKIKIRIDVETGAFNFPNPERKGDATLFVGERQDLPMSLVAIEEKWAFVNTSRLKHEKHQFYCARLNKEMARIFSYLCGAGDSQYPNSLMRAMTRPEDLDVHMDAKLPVDVMNRFKPYLEGCGITPWYQKSYAVACREGWAPAPTNDVQKVIWDKVHAMPTEPLKIKPETKKVRD